jgi:cytochrome c553
MRQVLLTLAALAVMGAAAGAAVVFIGLYNVSARAGHWPGVSWVLHTTFRNSVSLRAISADEVPDLSDPAMIELGARHYATACAPCHAVPGEERTATMRASEPEPPHIVEAVHDWDANELHWIVYNGAKMTGMPAWPAENRPQEVWPVVAYLMAVREGLEPDEQSALTEIANSEAPEGAAYCAGCHGGVPALVPRLDIQDPEYLSYALAQYRSGDRHSGVMEQAATRMTPEALETLAQYFGTMTPEGDGQPQDELARIGEALASRGTRDVPACSACHGPGATRSRPEFPSLSGQDRAYLQVQLRLWREGLRGGSHLMRIAAQDLTDADIAALSAYYAGLAPAKRDVAE